MKCNIKRLSSLAPSERKKILDGVEQWNKEFLENEMQKMYVVVGNNLFKLFLVAANETCGLGKVKLERILQKLGQFLDNKEKDEIFMEHIEEQSKKIMTKEIYDKYFVDVPFNF